MRKILAFFLVLSTCLASGQDVHFSQFFFSPQTLSPAEIGNFDAKYRLNANQKTQWREVSTPYSTFALMGDGQFNFLPEEVALGIVLSNDRAGDSKFNTFSILPGGSYTYELNEQHGVIGGIQTGMTQISIDESALTFNNQHNGAVFDPNRPTGESLARNSRWYFNLNLGFNYIYTKEPRKKIIVGIAGHNLSSPEQSFYNETGVKLPLRTSMYANGEWKINEDIDIMPSVRWMNQSTFNEVIIGTSLRYILLNERTLYRAIFAGFYGRIGDSGIAMAGFEIDEWRFAMSYDINVSDLDVASQNRGGLEFSLQYLFGRKDRTKGMIHKYCPDYL